MNLCASGNVVITKYTKNCCKVLVTNTYVPKALNNILKQLKSSKSQEIRDSCMEYTYLILCNWDVTLIESQMDLITEIVIVFILYIDWITRCWERCKTFFTLLLFCNI